MLHELSPLELKIKKTMLEDLYLIRALGPKGWEPGVKADRRHWTKTLVNHFPQYRHLIVWYNKQVEKVVYGERRE